jgi:hypothetical protein
LPAADAGFEEGGFERGRNIWKPHPFFLATPHCLLNQQGIGWPTHQFNRWSWTREGVARLSSEKGISMETLWIRQCLPLVTVAAVPRWKPETVNMSLKH